MALDAELQKKAKECVTNILKDEKYKVTDIDYDVESDSYFIRIKNREEVITIG